MLFRSVELDYARRRFVLECRAAGIEPIDAPYTFTDSAGAAQEAQYARRLGYRAKSLVRPDHTAAILAALIPSDAQKAQARAMVAAFDAARARGEDRALVDGLWVEVPTYLNAKRLLAQPSAVVEGRPNPATRHQECALRFAARKQRDPYTRAPGGAGANCESG